MLNAQPIPRSFGLLKRDYRLLDTLLRLTLLGLAVAWILAPFTRGPSAFNIIWAASAAGALCGYAVRRLRLARRIPSFGLRASETGVTVTAIDVSTNSIPWMIVTAIRPELVGREAFVVAEARGRDPIAVHGLLINGLWTPWAKRRALARLQAVCDEILRLRPGWFPAAPPPALRRHRWLAIAGVVLGLCGLLTVVSDDPGSAGVRHADLVLGGALCVLALAAGALAMRGVWPARVSAQRSWAAVAAIALAAAGLIGLPLQ